MRKISVWQWAASVAIAAAGGVAFAEQPPTVSTPDREPGTTAPRPTPDTAIPDNEHLTVPPGDDALRIPEHRSGTLQDGDGASIDTMPGEPDVQRAPGARPNQGKDTKPDPDTPSLTSPPPVPRTPADVLNPITPT